MTARAASLVAMTAVLAVGNSGVPCTTSAENPSAVCVKLVHADAVAFFDYLQVGNEVQVR